MRFYTLFTFLLILFTTTTVFSQEKIKHTVVQGESVYSIAKKYDVKSSEILDLNPKAKKLLKLKMVLLIPNKNFKQEKTSKEKISKETTSKENEPIIHEVLAKETLYGISKKYKISIDKIKEANPTIETEGLKLGSKIIIPTANEVITETALKPKAETKVKVKPSTDPVVEDANEDEELVHQVLPKETKYGISKQYKISIAELEKLNPEIVNGLPVGFQLVIKKGTKTKTETPTEISQVKTPVAQVEEEEEEEETDEVVTPIGSNSSQIKIIGVKPSDSTADNTAVVEAKPLSEEGMSKADFLIAKASENIGVHYRSGGTTKAGFDCSGLMFTTFKEVEMTLPRSSREMASYGNRIDRSQAQKGDLIFFTTNGRGNINHVGMVTEVLEDEIKFIHSSVHSGVIVSSTKEAYYAKRFVQVNRVLE